MPQSPRRLILHGFYKMLERAATIITLCIAVIGMVVGSTFYIASLDKRLAVAEFQLVWITDDLRQIKGALGLPNPEHPKPLP